MLMLQHNQVRRLLHTEEVNKIAEETGMPVGLISQLKLEWTRKFLHKCVVCGKPVEEGKVTCCPGTVLDPRPVGVLLMQLPQNAPLRSRPCSKCGKTFNSSVARELRAFRRGFVVDLCGDCRRERYIVPLNYRPFEELAGLRPNLPKKAKKENHGKNAAARGDVRRQRGAGQGARP